MIEGIGGRAFPLQPQELPGYPGAVGAPGIGGAQKPGAGQGSAGVEGGADFSSTMKQFLGEVNDMQLHSDSMIQAFARGEATDLHQVVLAQQEASIALRLVTEMRDRLLSAYQEVMRTTM